jgi:hypothetical protein
MGGVVRRGNPVAPGGRCNPGGQRHGRAAVGVRPRLSPSARGGPPNPLTRSGPKLGAAGIH